VFLVTPSSWKETTSPIRPMSITGKKKKKRMKYKHFFYYFPLGFSGMNWDSLISCETLSHKCCCFRGKSYFRSLQVYSSIFCALGKIYSQFLNYYHLTGLHVVLQKFMNGYRTGRNKCSSNVFRQNIDTDHLDIHRSHLGSLTSQGQLGSSYLICDVYVINIDTQICDLEHSCTE